MRGEAWEGEVWVILMKQGYMMFDRPVLTQLDGSGLFLFWPNTSRFVKRVII